MSHSLPYQDLSDLITMIIYNLGQIIGNSAGFPWGPFVCLVLFVRLVDFRCPSLQYPFAGHVTLSTFSQGKEYILYLLIGCYQWTIYFFNLWSIEFSFVHWPVIDIELKKNIARSKKAAQSTYHWLLRCQVVLTKQFFSVLKLSNVRSWFLGFCQNLSC